MTNQYSYAEDFAEIDPIDQTKKIAESNISSAAKVYMLSRINKNQAASGYRSGNDNGHKYMTSEDFVTYFQNRGKISTNPEKIAKSTVSGAEIYRSRSEAKAPSENSSGYRSSPKRNSYGAPNVEEGMKIYRSGAKDTSTTRTFGRDDSDVKIYSPGAKAAANKFSGLENSNTVRFNGKKDRSSTAVFRTVDTSKFSKVKKIADEWIPEDKIVNVRQRRKSGSFSKIVLAMAGVAVSLMLIVSGSVLMSGANREVKKLENELKQLEKTEEQLLLELEMKNDVNVLRDRASGDLRMIRKEYVDANYLGNGGKDGIEVFEDDNDDKGVGISAILSAFGIG
jgi:hypothetical protein